MKPNLAIFLGTLLLFVAIATAAFWGYILSLLFKGILSLNAQTVLGTLLLFLTVVLLISVLYSLINRQQKLALQRVTSPLPPPTTIQPLSLPNLTPTNRELQDRLYGMLMGDRQQAERLVTQAKQKHPGMSEDWYWEKAITDLERDRR